MNLAGDDSAQCQIDLTVNGETITFIGTLEASLRFIERLIVNLRKQKAN